MIQRRPNLIAVLVAAVVFWLFGAIWYGAIWGVLWLELIGKTAEEAHRYGAIPFIAGLGLGALTAYAIAWVASLRPQHSLVQGAMTGLRLGVLVYGATMLTEYLFEGRPVALWLITGGWSVIGMTLMGAVIGAMRPR